MQDFKDFIKNNQAKDKDFIKNNQNNNSSSKNIDDDQIASAKQTINKYTQMSEEELMIALAKAVSTKKSEGSFDKQAIKSQIDIIGNFLGEDKKQQMQKILDKLDDEIK